MFLSSLYIALVMKIKIWQTSDMYFPQTFSVTAAVVVPAVVICLNSLLIHQDTTNQRKTHLLIVQQR